jgi:holo-[acyl-carrier protein] synthase
MIIGIGNDMANIDRLQKTLDRYGDRFTARCFTANEIKKASRRANPAATYAKRFAAKEACAKALGTGLSHGVFWRDMEVANLPTGQPTMILTCGALERLRKITPSGMTTSIHVTLTDELPLAEAFVVISAEPTAHA